ncbi:MMPL family transporter [Nocardioides sp. YIM 152588]|uniref:MMPL family transporter n=1 Tax=Nocardioides sp. YIM 152588 TaxID=3158259 RepID=UPI0032E45CE0
MARLLYRLGSTAYRRWPYFIAAWVVLAVTIGGLAAAFSKPMQDEFTIPGIPAEEAAELQQQLFPDAGDAMDDPSVNVVVAAPEGHTLDEPQYAAAIADLITAIPELPQMSDAEGANPQLVDPVVAAEAREQLYVQAAEASGGDVDAALENAASVSPLSEDGRIGTMTFAWDVDSNLDIEAASQEALAELLAETTDETGLIAEANGGGMTDMAQHGMSAELIGLGVALLVLLLTFGSLVAAGLPLLNAVVGVGLGLGGVAAATALTDTIGSSTTGIASMLGLAVGIDYTLFLLARYRTELHHTDDRRHAAGIAVGTAGSAVVFAGLTVLIALSALAVVGIPFLTAMGLAAAVTVLLAVLVALTLLPAILGMLKSKAFGGQVRKYSPKRDEDHLVVNNGVRWARLLGRAPLAFAALVVVVLGALAVPVAQMQTALPSDSTASPETTQRKAADLVTEGFGPGREGVLLAVVDGRGIDDDATRQQTFADVAAWAGQQEGVANAQVVLTNAPTDETGTPTGPATGAMIRIVPESGPTDQATIDLLAALRAGEAELEASTDTVVGITGLTAIGTDVSDRLSDALPVYLAIVVGLAFVLLVVVFRSILVPLTATLGFLLSIMATFGATVLIFQEGALGLVEGAPIISFLPVMLIGIVFGLAMDYQVFLVSRMREAHVHGMSTREAVIDGFRNSARVVSAAATIMLAVFGAFILIDNEIIKVMGFALAASILFDAFIVRMVLIPAVLFLLGEKAWWIPAWLDRILPNVDIEGEALERDSIPGRKPLDADRADDWDGDRDDDLEVLGV